MISNNIVTIMGSTGFIGRQALDVAKQLGMKFLALAADKSVDLMEEQIRRFKPKYAVMSNLDAAKELKIRVKDTNTEILAGKNELCNNTLFEKADIVVNAIVGVAGFLPSISIIKCKKKLALANKESLVVAGELIIKLAKENKVQILPIDSEHCAIFQCLEGKNSKEYLKKIILTASGGPFFGKCKNELKNVKSRDALKHPTWNMGAKISIDSATMMNKGFELIEAHWLFDVDPTNIEILVHRESIVHSMVEFVDNSVIANLAVPDMRLPIQYALTYPKRYKMLVQKLELSDVNKLTFFKPDYNTFGAINICKNALNIGGTLPAVVNGVNEAAVELFLEDRISFLEITEIVKKACNEYKNAPLNSVENVFSADKWARNFVKNYFAKK